jgi:arginine-tRNA-protein transferase
MKLSPDMARTPRINLYATQGHPCSYLAGQEASTEFIDPHHPVNAETYDRLSALGFRRSGQHIYRPQCQSCQACIPIRLPVGDFKPSRQQTRVWKRNQDISIAIVEDIQSGEHYALYEHYIQARHADGDMYPPSREQFDTFLGTPFCSDENDGKEFLPNQAQLTCYVEFRLGTTLKGIAVTDVLPSGLSAVYTFFDPDDAVRSLGVFAVLFQVELARKLALPYLYLGYWIKDSRKMGYKSNYTPHEIFYNGVWQRQKTTE